MFNGGHKKEESETLREAIMEVIAFFDLFEYPLTAREIRHYLGAAASAGAVMRALDAMRAPGKAGDGFAPVLVNEGGFYFLPGRDKIVRTRLRRYSAAERKFRRARRAARFFRLIPWIRMIAVGNIMGARNARAASDIDLFIVTARNRVWLARLFCAGLIKIFGLRPTPDRHADRICLSFYAAEDALDLGRLMLYPPARADGKTGDIYFYYWLACLVPIFDRGGQYERLISSNPWLSAALPNWRRRASAGTRETIAERAGRRIADLFLGGFEGPAKRWQLKIMPEETKKLLNRDTRVVADGGVIKLHPNDRREEYRVKYQEKIKVLNYG